MQHNKISIFSSNKTSANLDFPLTSKARNSKNTLKTDSILPPTFGANSIDLHTFKMLKRDSGENQSLTNSTTKSNRTSNYTTNLKLKRSKDYKPVQSN